MKNKMMKMMELLAEKEGKKDEEMVDDKSKTAKMDILQELIDLASDRAGNDLVSGMQSVKVAAPDKEGLEKGLEKAKELIDDDADMAEKAMEDVDEDLEEPDMVKEAMEDVDEVDESKLSIEELIAKRNKEEEDEEAKGRI